MKELHIGQSRLSPQPPHPRWQDGSRGGGRRRLTPDKLQCSAAELSPESSTDVLSEAPLAAPQETPAAQEGGGPPQASGLP